MLQQTVPIGQTGVTNNINHGSEPAHAITGSENTASEQNSAVIINPLLEFPLVPFQLNVLHKSLTLICSYPTVTPTA